MANAVDDVNAVRRLAALPELSSSVELTNAAQAHARYLQRYSPSGRGLIGSAHEQRKGLPEFTGHLAADRALYFGYPHSQVTENVSLGNDSIQESISILMSAIYHRFAFLDPLVDEIGAAQAGRSYVFNMGKKQLSQICLNQPEVARMMPPHSCKGQLMKHSAYLELCANLPREARYMPPYPYRCPDGSLLREEVMQAVCANPPAGAELKGAGRYYDMCDNGLKLSAKWLNRVCGNSQSAAHYPYSGASYSICPEEVPVYAEWYENMCDTLPDSEREQGSGTYYDFCSNGFEIKSEFYDGLEQEALQALPEAVLWPADDAVSIQPVFYNEDPHPTPDLLMTGYPVSIQFNPRQVQDVSIMGFTLERKQDTESGKWEAVEGVRQIDHLTDINGEFTPYQFAWFPLQRLKWSSEYRYRVDALVDGGFKRYSARFRTTDLPVPLYEVDAESNTVRVQENHFIIYREPDSYDMEPFRSVDLNYRGRPYIDVNVIDTNTVEVQAGGSGCAPIVLNTRLQEPIYIEFCARG